MRRVLLSLMLLTIIVTGCTDLAELLPEPDDEGETANIYTPPTPRPFPPERSTAARIRERGSLLVGVRYDLEPFSFVGQDGHLAGLEVELAQELAQRWLGDREAVQFRQVRSDTAIPHLLAGDVDLVLAGIIHTQQAEADADFGLPYFMNGQALLTYPDTGIAGLADVGDKVVGGVQGGEGLTLLQEQAPVTPTLAPYDSFSQVVEALRTRQIAAYADQRHRLERVRRLVSGVEVVGQYTFEPMTPVYREDDPFFADLVATTFRAMSSDGTRDALYDRWLPGASPPSGPAWPGSRTPPALADAPMDRTTRDTLGVIRERGVVNVGYFPSRWPYSADRGDGVPTGFEVRLLAAMAGRWLGDREAVNYLPVTEATGFQQLQAGEVDLLLGGWIHTQEAEQQVDFSRTLLNDGVSLLSPTGVPVEGLADLGGQPVGVIAGTVGAAELPELSQQAGVGLNPLTYPDRESAVAALQQGEIAALAAERRILLDPFYRIGGFYLPDARLTYRPVAFILPRGDSDFRDLVNLTLATMHADGSFAELYRTWFDDPVPDLGPWPGAPTISLTLRAAP